MCFAGIIFTFELTHNLPLQTLSEDIVKKTALQFLKGYYRYRPRGPGDTIARLDMVAAGGIRADGHLTFGKEDGSPFLATFEATGKDSHDEVLFKRQQVLLNMDALAGAMLLGALSLGILVAVKWGVFLLLGRAAVIAMIVVYISMWFFLIRLTVQGWKRYRYIYALEQFKRYYADQQWIALAEDVFEPTDENYIELKDECVDQGYGLLLVDSNLKVQLVLTPARVQVAKKKRAEVVFEDARAWSLRMTDRLQTGWFAKLPPWLEWVKLLALPDFSLTRFKRSYTLQLLLMPACITAMMFFIREAFKDPPLQYADESEYLRELELLTKTDRRETGEYFIDTPFVEQFKKAPSMAPVMEEESIVSKDTVAFSPGDLIPGLGEEPQPRPKPKPERAKPSVISAYDCDRYYGIRGPRYVVLYDMVLEEELGKRQLDTIYHAGIEAGMVWMGCFETGSSSFAVYMGTIFETMEEASSQKEKFQFILEEEGINKPLLRLRVLNFR